MYFKTLYFQQEIDFIMQFKMQYIRVNFKSTITFNTGGLKSPQIELL